MNIEDAVRDVVRSEIEALDIPAIVAQEVRRVLLSGLAPGDAKPPAKPKAPKKTEDGLECTVDGCDFVTKSKQGFSNHRAQKHGAKTPRNSQDRKSRGGEFKCTVDECARSFSKPNGLSRHLAVSHPEFKLPIVDTCETCGEGFTNHHSFRIHNMRDHQAKPTDMIECDECGHSFQRNGIKRHKTLKHKSGPPPAMNIDAPEEPRNPSVADVIGEQRWAIE